MVPVHTLMAAYAEGLVVLRNADMGKAQETTDAESAPLRDSNFYRYELDTSQIAEVLRRGSVIGPWLLDLTAAGLLRDPDLSGFSGRVSDSGEGWTVEAAVREGVPPTC
jgi:6-phosphogluconate dehydrogenase